MTHDDAADNPYTRGMAAFVSKLRYERIPEDVIGRIKLLILDSIGCAIYSVDLEWSRILISTLSPARSFVGLRCLGHVGAPVCTSCRARQRYPGARI